MQQRQLGPFSVSAIGLGCMNMSMGYGAADDRLSERLLRESLDAGYTFYDTASMYGMGHNETLLGRALGKQRDQFVLASKCGIHRSDDGSIKIDGRPEVLKRTCEQSLRRLQTEVIDLYYLHRVDPRVAIEESVGALAELVSEGKIRALGLSEVSVQTLRRAHAVHPVTAVQSEYSLWSRSPERQMLGVCRQLGVAFVPFSPLGRGFWAGSAQDVSQLAEDDIRATIARPRFEPDAFASNSRLLIPYAELARRQGCSFSQLALSWILAKSDNTLLPIPGTRSIAHMQENAVASTIRLEPEVEKALDRLTADGAVSGERYNAALMASVDSEQ